MPQLEPAGHNSIPVPGVKVPMEPGVTGAAEGAPALRRLVGPAGGALRRPQQERIGPL
jgi:hypothetical protein